MLDLARAVDDLVTAATSEADPRSLKDKVESVLDAFESAAEPARTAALRSLGRALGSVEGRGGQVLCLALGALVEGGAAPELAWPAIANDLAGLLDRATAFAGAAVKQAKDQHVDTAIEAVGAVVAKKKPREAAAWKAVPARCLAAVACLTRSKALRARVRKDQALETAAWPLSDVMSEVGDLLQALRIVDDETLLVLAPNTGRGWRVAIDAMPSNAELYILLGDALIGDPRKGRLPGKRPDPKAVLAIREGTQPPKRAATAQVPFHLVAWTAVASDGSLPPADPHETDHWIWMEGIPADIPLSGKERVALLQDAPYARPIPATPSFESLRPDVRITAELSADEVARTMIKLGKAAAKAHPAKAPTPAKAPRPPAKKASAKKAPAKKKPTRAKA